MKKLIFTILIALTVFACSKSEDNPAPEQEVVIPSSGSSGHTVTESDYWGCWKPLSQQAGAYDNILTEGVSQQHGFILGDNCVDVTFMQTINTGVFRNDTLIFYMNNLEYWYYITNDTLSHHVYDGNQTPILKFIK